MPYLYHLVSTQISREESVGASRERRTREAESASEKEQDYVTNVRIGEHIIAARGRAVQWVGSRGKKKEDERGEKGE
jgi:hypothetical protein